MGKRSLKLLVSIPRLLSLLYLVRIFYESFALRVPKQFVLKTHSLSSQALLHI